MKRLIGKLSSKSKNNKLDGSQELPSTAGINDAALDRQACTAAQTSTSGVPSGFREQVSGSLDGGDPLVGTRYRLVCYLKNQGMGQAVVLAEDTTTQEQVVVKLLERGPNITSKVEPEILRHFKCAGHPAIVQLYDLLLTPRHLAIVMEFCAGSDLQALISQRGRLTEPEARFIFQQIVSALRQYHAVGMTKRDLRLENVLLASSHSNTSASPPRPMVKLADFAYSKSEQVNSDPKSALGSLVYTAPEDILMHNNADERSADVWAAGVVLYVMLAGQFPFGQLTGAYDQKQVQQMLERILKVEYQLPEGLSHGARDLLSHLLVDQAAARFTLQQICEHPWFTQDLPADFWTYPRAAAAISNGAETNGSAAELDQQRQLLCREAQRGIVSSHATDIDQLADDIMDMEACEATFDDLGLQDDT